MADRRERLRKLVVVQEKLKSLHEGRRAGHLAEAAAARTEAQDLAARLDAEGSLVSLFPELYGRHISAAVAREQAGLEAASAEAAKIAAVTARGNRVAREYRAVSAEHERASGDRERLERASRTSGRK